MLSALLPPLIIWVHGTIPDKIMPQMPSWMSPNKIELYQRFFHCEPGLHKATELGADLHHRVIAQTLASADPEQFSLDEFYCFGWSGKLSAHERLIAAKNLYAYLQDVIEDYEKKHGVRPPKIIGYSHSHGGNVLLNLPRVKDAADPLAFDELWLLACPVQKGTARYVASPMFKKIFSVHSHFDMIQVADPQGLSELKDKLKSLFVARNQKAFKEVITFFQEKAFFSERHFDQNLVTHIHIVSKGRNLMHVEFLLLPFINALPRLCTIAREIADSEKQSQEHTVDIAHWKVQSKELKKP